MPRNIVTFDPNDLFDQKGYQSFRAYFGNVLRGQPDIYDTPFAKGESTKNLLKAWKSVLVSISDKWPSLWEFEEDLAAKVGPLSVMKPLKERITDIDNYYDDILVSSQPLDSRAVAAVKAEWTLNNRIQVRDMAKTLKLMKKSTNSGTPYFTKRRNVVDKTVPCEAEIYKQRFVRQWLAGEMYQAAAVIGWRGQEGGPSEQDVKQRVVWMFPFALNILELQVYQPLIEVAQRYNKVPSWVSMEQVDKEITAMFDTKADNDLVVCTDFDKFDQHFNVHLQDVARTILAYVLRLNKSSSGWLREVFPIKYMIPLIVGSTRMRTGRHGMASGSGGTNADETLAHRALQYEVAIRNGARLNPHSQCLGDDGVLTYPGITVDDVVKSYVTHGLEMNITKQHDSTQDCIYLRRWHHKDYRIDGVCAGVYSTCRALGRLRYLERYMDPEVWDHKMVALRQLSIIENVKYHPLRESFVDFCMKRDKYRLGIDIPGFLENIVTIAKEAIDYMPDFLGYTKTLQSGNDPTAGIGDWWIVKYLKSKA